MIIDDRDTPLISVRVVNPGNKHPVRLRAIALQGLLETSAQWSTLPVAPEHFEHCAGLPFILEPISSIIAHYSDHDAEMLADWTTFRSDVETEDGKHWYSPATHLRGEP